MNTLTARRIASSVYQIAKAPRATIARTPLRTASTAHAQPSSKHEPVKAEVTSGSAKGESSKSKGAVEQKDAAKVQMKGGESGQQTQMKRKTQADLDKEMQEKMSALAGDGGEAGVELEDGQPVAMKRGVKTNMFRLI